MKHATNPTGIFSSPSSFLTAVFGCLAEEVEKKIVDTAWLFAYSVLWNDQQFSEKERLQAKFHIKQWLNATSTLNALKKFCQCIIVAKQNYHLLNKDVLVLPSLWFDAQNQDGFSATYEWFNKISIHRHSLPKYKEEIKALAEAVIEFTDEPTKKNFQYWRTYFIEREMPLLLNLYTVFCANKQLNIQ